MTPNNQHDEQDADTGRPDDLVVITAAAGKATPERDSGNPRQSSQKHNRRPPLDDDGEPPIEHLVGDLLVTAGPIEAYLKTRGIPKPNAYYFKRSGWPIGSTGGTGGKLIASKRRLDHHIDKLTRGSAAA
jgi:hypothetical protein